MTCRIIGLLLASAILLQPTSVVAQERSLEEAVPQESRQSIEFPMRAGDYIRLHPVDGERVSGKVEDFDGSVVSVEGKSFDLSRGDVKQIELRIDDSLSNGALIGAGAAATYVGVACINGGCDDAVFVTAGAVIAAAGAGLGALIDSLRHGYETIYPAPTPETTWTIAPLIDGDKKGVVFSLSF